MFNRFSPYYNNYNNSNFNTIMIVINEGMDILRKSSYTPISSDMVNIWQRYTQSILNNVISYSNSNLILEYNLFLTTINSLPPYERLSKSIEKLLEIARKI